MGGGYASGFSFFFEEGRVVILKQGCGAMLKLPTLAFYSSLFPKLPVSLYPLLLPNYHFCPIISLA